MTQVCRVCSNKDRKGIDRAIVTNGNLSKIARDFSISYDSIYRHSKECLARQLLTGAKIVQKNQGVNLLEAMLEKMNELTERTESLLGQAEEKDQVRNALLAVQQLRNNYQAVGTIIASMGQTGFGMDPDELEEFREWQNQRDTLGSQVQQLSKEDRELLEEACLLKISKMNGVQEIEGLKAKSLIFAEYSPSDIEVDLDPIADKILAPRKQMMRRTMPSQVEDSSMEEDPPDNSMRVQPIRSKPIPGTEGTTPYLRTRRP